MASLISTLARFVTGPRPDLVCPAEVWEAGVAELRRRAGGSRESGALLLGTKGRTRRIREFVFYDDVDPGALDSGIVIIDGRRLGALWAHCRATGLEVVADAHVHPRGFGQSGSDRNNPVISEIGHRAIIIPHFATKATEPDGIGFYTYRGARTWRDDSRLHPSPFHVGWWPSWR